MLILGFIGNRELERRSPSKSSWWGAGGGKAATSTPPKGDSWGPAAPNPTTFITYKVYCILRITICNRQSAILLEQLWVNDPRGRIQPLDEPWPRPADQVIVDWRDALLLDG